MRYPAYVLAAGLSLLLATAGEAADFDGSKPFLCATTDVASCVPAQDCQRESTGSVNAPQFFIVDVGKMTVSDAGPGSSGRSSRIDHVHHQAGLMLLTGTEGVSGWVASIGETSGKLSYAVVGERNSVVTFGACTVQ